jgi:cytochrome c
VQLTSFRIFALTAALALALPAHAAMDAKSAGEMMIKSGCNACHQIDKKVLGPSYKDVSVKYKGNAKAAETLFQKVRTGGMGAWGPIPMPPNPKEKISDADLHALIGWLLTL